MNRNICWRCNEPTLVLPVAIVKDTTIVLDAEPTFDGTVFVYLDAHDQLVAHPLASELGLDVMRRSKDTRGRMYMPHARTCRGRPK